MKSRLLGMVWGFVYFLSLSFCKTAVAASLVLQPGTIGKDAQIANEGHADDNLGDSVDLISNVEGGGSAYRSIGLIEFDLSSIPNNADITSATLSIYHENNNNLGSRYDVFRTTSAWDEATVTFNTAPTFDLIAVDTLIIPDSVFGVFRDWDVTSLVSSWLNGTYSNYGMWIEEIPVQGSAHAWFSSSDQLAPYRPKLSVEYSIVPIPTALVLFGSGLIGLVGMARHKKA